MAWLAGVRARPNCTEKVATSSSAPVNATQAQALPSSSRTTSGVAPSAVA